MTWYAWALVALIVLSSLVTVKQIGQPRKSTTPGSAVAVLIANGLMVWAVVALATRGCP